MASLLRRAIRKYLLEKLDRANVQSHLEGDITVQVRKVGYSTLDTFITALVALVREVAPEDTFQLLTKSEGAQSYLVRFTTSSLNVAFKGIQSTALHMDRLNARIKAATEQGITSLPLATNAPTEDIQRAEVVLLAPAPTPVRTPEVLPEVLAEVPELALTATELVAAAKAKRAGRKGSKKGSKRASK